MSVHKSDHAVLGNNSTRCLHCGIEQPFPVPCSLSVFGAICEAFADDHEGCEPQETGRARFRYETLAEWLGSWDTGTSSLTICSALLEGGLICAADVPHDPADFGRCYRLLELRPDWRGRLQEVADVFADWQPLVDRWDELEKLWEEESKGDEAPRLYELLKELRP